jgi:methionyl-tRNA formyltransferase
MSSNSQGLPQPQPKLLILADGHVGVEILRYLFSAFKGDVAAVVSCSENAVFELARHEGVPVHVYDASPALFDKLPPEVTLGILAWWPSLLKEPLLSYPSGGFVNTHPSFLPHNRGKHPNFWSIVEQRPFGVSLQKVAAGIDAGPILAQRRIEYDWTDSGGTLYKRALEAMIDLFKETYPSIRRGDLDGIKQGTGGSLHFARELDSASRINLDDEYRARDLLNLLRARTFEGHPSCYFTDDGDTYEVRVNITRKLTS